MSWETVIGLEVHVQLSTQSKMFCGCSSAFGNSPNTNVCPTCLGLPGALPVANREAARLATRTALALDFTIHPTSVFARKNYFYPDLPKGYQISQFDRPLATAGRLRIMSPDRGDVPITITRLHLEEDAGKSLHDRIPERTALDFNRAGVPLMEIVTEPELHSPAEARAFLVVLKQTLQYLEVSDCDMEKGHLRVDANLSIRSAGSITLGVKQEVKNMNSFAAAVRALEQLRDRQIQLAQANKPIELTTFSAASGTLRVMRTKEESNDYRYLAEPDLPPLTLDDDWLAKERSTLPELPDAKQIRFRDEYGIRRYDAEVLTATRHVADYFEAVIGAGAPPKETAKWVMGSVLREAKASEQPVQVSPARLATLIALVQRGDLSTQAAKRVYGELTTSAEEPRVVAERLGLLQVHDDDQISIWVNAVLGTRASEIARYRDGETKLLGFFMGQIMQQSGGKADPERVRAKLLDKLQSAST